MAPGRGHACLVAPSWWLPYTKDDGEEAGGTSLSREAADSLAPWIWTPPPSPEGLRPLAALRRRSLAAAAALEMSLLAFGAPGQMQATGLLAAFFGA